MLTDHDLIDAAKSFMEDVLHVVNEEAKTWEVVGSRATCDPAPEGTDFDVLVLANHPWEKLVKLLNPHGFEAAGSIPANELDMRSQSDFVSVRRGDLNLIITHDPDFFTKFMLATRTAKRLNLLKKEDRVALFQFILYGNG